MADGGNTMDVKPTEDISVREMFGLDTDLVVKGFADRSERVPEIDMTYKFDPDTTMGRSPQCQRDKAHPLGGQS